MKGRLNYIALCLLSLLFACREGKNDEQLLNSIEQTWQLCEISLPEAEARAKTLEDSVQKASELVRQRFSLLTIRLRDKRDMIPSSPDRTICLLKIGMKPAQIANVMDAKIQTVWNRVKRAEETCGDLLAVSE
jgi:DNA-directed RNA polymerase specialized sigma24 family protein